MPTEPMLPVSAENATLSPVSVTLPDLEMFPVPCANRVIPPPPIETLALMAMLELEVDCPCREIPLEIPLRVIEEPTVMSPPAVTPIALVVPEMAPSVTELDEPVVVIDRFLLPRVIV